MTWLPFAERIESPNHSTRPSGVSVVGTMQHTTVSAWASALAELTRADASPVSAHFLIGLDGRIAQLVDTDRVAWAQMTCNDRYLSIEHVDNGDHADGERTPEQYAASARVNAALAELYGYTPSAATVPGHRTCVNTACPSGLDLDRIIAETLGGSAVPTPAEWQQHLEDEANTMTAIKALLNPIATWVFDAPNRPLGARHKRALATALAVLDAASKPPPRTVARKKPSRADVRAGHGR